MRIVPINCIKDGTTLAKNIYNSSGNILLRKGTLLTSSLIQKIKNSDIHTVYIDDGYSEIEIEDIIKPELKNTAVKTIKEAFKTIEGDIKQSLESNGPLNKRLQTKVMSKYLDKLKNISDSIIDDILASHNLLINVIDIKHINDYTYEHSLNVGVLALVLGIELRLSRHDLYCLFIGGMLHDLGKVFIEQSILDKGDTISDAEKRMYQTHAERGYEYIKENHGISATSKIVILQHHEHYDGSGYPLGTSGDNIHRFAKIIAICDTYDRLTSDSPNSPAVSAGEALEYIMGAAGSIFDFDLVNTFCRKVNPYPPGSLVDLSDKRTAVVIDNNVNFPLRPIIQIVALIGGRAVKQQVIDLLKVNDITIDRLRYKDVTESE